MRCVAVILAVAALCGQPSLAGAQQAPQASAPAGATDSATDSGTEPVPAEPINPDALPVDLDKIQRALSRPPAIRPESTRPVFRVQVFGRNPTITDILGPDFLKGPAMAGPMTHQEFLNMVTPKDVQGYAAFDNKQGMIVAATSFALQWALRQAVQKFEDARTARQKEAARKEVDEALAALRKARRDAGLPD
jgi:hypothetical protein